MAPDRKELHDVTVPCVSPLISCCDLVDMTAEPGLCFAPSGLRTFAAALSHKLLCWSVMSHIFISYRREDTAAYAGRLYDHLKTVFSSERLFMDVDHIDPGEDFFEVIKAKISGSRVLLVLIGRSWATCSDADGTRRLDNQEDFVRLELAAALDSPSIRVIPVLVGGAPMPRLQQLPSDISKLSRRNAIELSDVRFHQDVDRLVEVLRKVIADPEIAPPRVPNSVPGSKGSPVSSESSQALEENHVGAVSEVRGTSTRAVLFFYVVCGLLVTLVYLIWVFS